MSSYLSQLQNEAILLMYLANELPAEDRAEVEAMLAQDESLQAQLTQLRSAYASVDSALGSADQQVLMPNTFAAARAVGDMVRQRHEQPANTPSEDSEVRSRVLRFAMYPVAAAALLAIGMLAWWRAASAEVEPPQLPPVAYRTMLDFGRTTAGNIDQMTDDQLWLLFEPVVVERGTRAQREYQRELAGMDLLREPLQ